ncbi:MAG: hypothetical protein OHK0022_45980 [Roseiflexaceae bacterium]
MRSRLSQTLIALLALALLWSVAPAHAAPARVTASDLRALLTSQLQEHAFLAASATGAALGGRDAEFKAAADALDANSVDISKSIGLVYGSDAEKAFLPLWRKHIGFFVDYTTGTAAKDKAKQDKAVADLVQYTEDFGAFLSSANPNLPKATVADLVRTHVLTLKDVVDAQAAGNPAKAYDALRMAYSHMDMIAAPLSGAIAKQFPDKFAGSTEAADTKLRVSLTSLLQEHAALATSATGAALGGRDAEFKAAADSLDANSVDISKAIGSVYGADAEKAFLPLWRKHIGFFVDYTTGTAAKDKAKQDKAVADLVQYTEDFGAFLSSANPNLPKATVADLVRTHVLTLKDVVDAQAAGDPAKAFGAFRTSFAHMTMIADPLSSAISKQFPDKFGGATTGATTGGSTGATTGGTTTGSAPARMPATGGESSMPWGAVLGLAVLLALLGGFVTLRSRRSA